MIRLLILDISGVYTQIYDEMYIEESKLKEIKEKYIDNKFILIHIP